MQEPLEAGKEKESASGALERKAVLPAPWPKTSDLQNCKRMNLCCFNQLKLMWQFVTAAVEN